MKVLTNYNLVCVMHGWDCTRFVVLLVIEMSGNFHQTLWSFLKKLELQSERVGIYNSLPTGEVLIKIIIALILAQVSANGV